jgi:hypothetical protein
MLQAIVGNKGLWWRCGVGRKAGRHELGGFSHSHHSYIGRGSQRLRVVSMEGLDEVWSMYVIDW